VKLVDGHITVPAHRRDPLPGRTEEHDRRMAAELLEHPKERAEHIMLVDLARNDVGRSPSSAAWRSTS
jgi:anthranilate synthase component 1